MLWERADDPRMQAEAVLAMLACAFFWRISEAASQTLRDLQWDGCLEFISTKVDGFQQLRRPMGPRCAAWAAHLLAYCEAMALP